MMKEIDKVTIAVASCNNALYIKRCIDSILSQTYLNIEVLVIDDGSADNTQLLLKEYANELKIKVFFKENGGLSSVRQYGLDHAAGNYICFIDADDYLEPEYVSIMLKKLRIDKSDVCLCSTTFLYEDGSKANNHNFVYEESDKPIKLLSSLFADSSVHIDNYLTLTDSWNKMYRVNFLKSINVSFNMPKGLNGSDMIFNYKVALCEPTYSIVAPSLYNHVLYSKSAVHRKKKDLFSSYEKIIYELIEIANRKSILPVIKPRLYDIYLVNLRNAFVDILSESNAGFRKHNMNVLFERHVQLFHNAGFDDLKYTKFSSRSINLFSKCVRSLQLIYLYIIAYIYIKKQKKV